MPMTESMTLLWLAYGSLSLVVLLTGYLGLAFLPRLLRLVLTWLVAGVMWTPARFQLPLAEPGEVYTGLAPAAIVAAVGFLERSSALMMPALLLLLAGAAAGAAFGLLLWWRGRPRNGAAEADEARQAAPARRGAERREPVIG